MGVGFIGIFLLFYLFSYSSVIWKAYDAVLNVLDVFVFEVLFVAVVVVTVRCFYLC
jgi:hypothetical protein